jgi:hypothetical protein
MTAIRFRCPGCSQSLKVAAAKAGKKVRCNRCDEVVVVPSADAEEETPEKPPVSAEEPPRDTEVDPEGEVTREEPARRKKRRKGGDPAWRLPRLGLAVLLVAMGLSALVSVVPYLIPVSVWLRAPGTIMWLLILPNLIVGLIQAAGFGLCLCAPAHSGVRPFAIAALIAVLLSQGMVAVTIAVTPRVPDFTSDPSKVKLEDLRKMNEAVERMASVFALTGGIGALLAGFYEVSVPLMLRAFCQALNRTEFEPQCDAMLKIAVASIALRLVVRVVLRFFLLFLFWPLSLLSWGLGLAWGVLFLVVVVQLWGAMGKR